jgi:hypothetical protein
MEPQYGKAATAVNTHYCGVRELMWALIQNQSVLGGSRACVYITVCGVEW